MFLCRGPYHFIFNFWLGLLKYGLPPRHFWRPARLKPMIRGPFNWVRLSTCLWVPWPRKIMGHPISNCLNWRLYQEILAQQTMVYGCLRIFRVHWFPLNHLELSLIIIIIYILYRFLNCGHVCRWRCGGLSYLQLRLGPQVLSWPLAHPQISPVAALWGDQPFSR